MQNVKKLSRTAAVFLLAALILICSTVLPNTGTTVSDPLGRATLTTGCAASDADACVTVAWAKTTDPQGSVSAAASG